MTPAIKLHSYCVRLNLTNGHEVYLLCADERDAEAIYEDLSDENSPPFNPSRAGWVYADLAKAPTP